jgi:hypothetical protein
VRHLVVAAAVLTSTQARAETCRETARALLREHPSYVTYCAACADPAPSEPMRARKVTIEIAEEADELLMIDGQDHNPANIYVLITPALEITPARYDNLAALAGCPDDGAPPGLNVSTATEHGVLITPDWTPTQQTASQAPPPPPSPVAPPTIAPVVNVVEPASPWLLIVMFGGAIGAAVGVSAALLLRERRGRPARPRAIELADRLDRR